MAPALLTSLGVLAGSLLAYHGVDAVAGSRIPSSAASVNMTEVCLEVASSVSSASGVFFNGTEPYSKDIFHYAISSTQEAACSFEPGTPEDIGIALQILGKARCPFAVKGGGHTTNPGFSSTPGVQIAMDRFGNVSYDGTTQTATIGAGLIWDDVYAALESYGVNVAGGRATGIGVAGFTLGGGGWAVWYSWHANQYGLAIDTVEAFELVLPNGTVANVTADSQADLFFALKGGSNNFGIVTQFTFTAFPQTQVWGGTINYNASELDQLTKATAYFSAHNTDPKANIITSYGYSQESNVGQAFSVTQLFYDAPSPPAGLFDDFLTNSTSTVVFTRSFLSFIQSSDASSGQGLRTRYSTISIPLPGYSESFLQRVINESITWGSKLPLDSGYISFSPEPFLPNVYNHTTSPSAWPGSRTVPFSPFSISFGWTGNGSTDDVMIAGIKECTAELSADVPGADHLPLYDNYALADTPLQAMYGNNVQRLTSIKKEVDPENVMGLAGGFKF